MKDHLPGSPALPDDPFGAAERLFRQLAVERLDVLSSAWVRLESGRQIPEAMVDIRSVAHKIAGTAESLGHSELGHIAAEVERACDEGHGREAVQRALRPMISALAELTID